MSVMRVDALWSVHRKAPKIHILAHNNPEARVGLSACGKYFSDPVVDDRGLGEITCRACWAKYRAQP